MEDLILILIINMALIVFIGFIILFADKVFNFI